MHFKTFLAIAAMAAAQPVAAQPRIVVEQGSRQVATVPKLDAGKFSWASVRTKDKDGKESPYPDKVKWLVASGKDSISIASEGVQLWGGRKQGDAEPAWHAVPDGQVPRFSSQKIVLPGQFVFEPIVAASARPIGGHLQDEAEPRWHELPGKASVALLGVKRGSATLYALGVSNGEPVVLSELSVEVAGGSSPKPDEPPAPDVKPDKDLPISGEGFRVLITFDNSPTAKPMTAGQGNAIYGQAVRSYLQSKCAVGPDGVTKEFRIWPVSTVVSGESKTWQDAFARPRAQPLWIMISNGVSGTSEKLPETEAEVLALLKKYGG